MECRAFLLVWRLEPQENMHSQLEFLDMSSESDRHPMALFLADVGRLEGDEGWQLDVGDAYCQASTGPSADPPGDAGCKPEHWQHLQGTELPDLGLSACPFAGVRKFRSQMHVSAETRICALTVLSMTGASNRDCA